MNLRTHSQNGGLRVLSWVLAFALVFSLAAAASADPNTCSAELVFSAEGVDFSGKLALDTAQGLLGLIASVTSQGETAELASGYVNAQALAVDGPLVGGAAYGFDLNTLAENLPGSIFAPDSGSSFALDEESYNEILAMLSGELPEPAVMNSAAMDTEAVQQAAAVLKEAYSGILEDILAEMTIETTEAAVEVNGVSVPVNQVRCGVDGDGIINMMLISLDVLANNTDAQAAYAIIFDQYNAISDQSLTGEEFVQAMLSVLPQELEQSREELQGFSGVVTFCLSSATEAPVKFSLEIQDDYEQVAVNLLLSEALDFFRLESVEDGVLTASLQLDILANSDNDFACKLSVTDEYQTDSSLSFNLNKAAKTFALGALADGTSASLSGTYEITDTLFSLTVDKVDGQEFGGTLTLNLRSDDASLAMPDFTELTRMSEEEFTALVQVVMENVQSLSMLFAA